MASEQSAPGGSAPPAPVVGNAFVHQFFHILHKSPELVHRFYQEDGKMSRPGANGEMSTSSTLQEIDDKILSMDYSEYRSQIKTVDAQKSLDGGVIVLVTGYLIGKDDVKRDFAQTFFLTMVGKVYYVLNDIFRYVKEEDQEMEQQGFTSEIDTPISVEDDTIPSPEHHVPEQSASTLEEDEVNEDEVYDSSEHDERSAVDEEEVHEEVPVEEVVNEVLVVPKPEVTNPGSSAGQEQKMSYASIVRVMKENAAPVSVATSMPIRAAPTDKERLAPSAPAMAPSPASEVPAAVSDAAENSIVQESEADGHSIYIKHLPLTVTSAQLEETFKKFGPIKPYGIQVRNNKLQRFCFGFVEFEVASAVQNAIEASPIWIGGCQAYVEEKRPTGSRVNNRGRFAPGRGVGFRGDGMRVRGGYGGGRGYGRGGDYSNMADFGNRGGRGRGGDVGYQRVYHMGSNIGGRSRSGSLPRAPDFQ